MYAQPKRLIFDQKFLGLYCSELHVKLHAGMDRTLLIVAFACCVSTTLLYLALDLPRGDFMIEK